MSCTKQWSGSAALPCHAKPASLRKLTDIIAKSTSDYPTVVLYIRRSVTKPVHGEHYGIVFPCLIGGGASSDCGCTYVRVATSRHFTIIVHPTRLQTRIQPGPLPPEFPAPISFFFHDTTLVCDVAKPAPGKHVACACGRLELFFPSSLAKRTRASEGLFLEYMKCMEGSGRRVFLCFPAANGSLSNSFYRRPV